MVESQLLEAARAGDAGAIAALMNSALKEVGVVVRAMVQDSQLHILLESDRPMAERPSLEFITRGLERLGLSGVPGATIYHYLTAHYTPLWVQQITLASTPTIPPEPVTDRVRSPEVPPQAQSIAPAMALSPTWEQERLIDAILQLVCVLLVALSSTYVWNRYLSGGEPLPARLSLELEKSRPALPDFLYEAKKQAQRAVRQGEVASSPEQWKQAATSWRQAIDRMQAIPSNHPDHQLAQQKIKEYQGNLAIVLEKASQPGRMLLKETIYGAISPKSVVYSGNGLFFAQNMMYNHSVTVYDRSYKLVKTIPDTVNLAEYGHSQFSGSYQGAPVEASFSHGGRYAWVSNYEMYGAGLRGGAGDTCNPTGKYDDSFLYRINTESLAIEQVIRVGAVPKFVASVPDDRLVLTTNWCSWDLSVVDTQTNQEIRRLPIGPYPRGIAVDEAGEKAYIAVMGSYDIAVVNLRSFEIDWMRGVGHSPRHLVMAPGSRYLYATLNGEGRVAKINLQTGQVTHRVETGRAPRSMAISADGQYLYVVNYNSDSVSKVRTRDMAVVQTVAVNPAPIGITYDPETRQIWVACYSGSIMVFQD